MFNGCGFFDMSGDHLDISFRRTEEHWVIMTPKGSIRFTNFEIGDPVSGPNILLGSHETRIGEVVEWCKADPLHCHGSDHFRATANGDEAAGYYLIGNGLKIDKFPGGSFSFQEAGVIYREIPGQNSNIWLLHVVADRRGNPPIIPWESDRKTLFFSGNPNDRPLPEGAAYPDPLGLKGIPAVKTSLGPVDPDGYVNGSFSDLARRKTAGSPHIVEQGFIGDRATGPVVLLLKSDPGSLVSPPSRCGTERLLFVVKGSCRIGDADYRPGDVRIQRMDVLMPEMRVGDKGLEAVIIVADRRMPVQPSVIDSGAIDWAWNATLVN